jgi:transcription antitermination factor NusG
VHKVLFTRGVISIISFGSGPARVDDEIISFIQSRVKMDGLVEIAEELKHGDKVIIKAGACKDLVGIFEREMDSNDRVTLLLSTISYQANLVIERELVRKVV